MKLRARDPQPASRRVRLSALAVLVGAATMRVTLWAPEVCPDLSAARADTAAVDGGDWIVANQRDSGRYEYEFDRETGESSTDYNLVRHAGVTMSLYDLVLAGHVEFLEAADLGLDWMRDRMRRVGDDGRAFATSRRAKLGASALLTVSLAKRRIATGDHQHDSLMRELGRFMVGQRRADGSMLNLYDFDSGPVADQTSIYSTGEALWALALLHEAFPDDGFDRTAWAVLDYVTTARDEVEGFHPAPWPDQWAAYSLAEMVEWGLADHHVDYAHRLLARYATMIRWESQRGTFFGALSHGPTPRGAGFGTWIEGVGALRHVTLGDQRLAEHAGEATDLLVCGAARLADLQTEPGDDVPATEAGAWFFDGATRMDDQQHAASGLLAAADALG